MALLNVHHPRSLETAAPWSRAQAALWFRSTAAHTVKQRRPMPAPGHMKTESKSVSSESADDTR